MTLIDINKEDHIAFLTLNNPPVNVLSLELIDELNQVFSELAADEETRVVVVTGAGDKAFMAGADVRGFPRLLELRRAGAAKQSTIPGHRMLSGVENFPKPVIAAVNGMALGAGCELALACDIRIAAQSAQFGLPEIKLGLIPGGGGTQRLPRTISVSKAKEMMFTGDAISAEEAKECGLVSRVVPDDELAATVRELAVKLTKRSGASLKGIKEAVNRGLQTSIEEGLKIELDLFDQAFLSDDGREGVGAFLEKRKPVFTHK